jgi:glycosyltransferase involved in cell wall biosynthesis
MPPLRWARGGTYSSDDTGGRCALMNDCTIGVVVPAYNESELIGPTLSSIPPYIDRIYVVDDGSADRTAEVVKASSDKRIKLIQHEQNRGVGAAIITGYDAAMMDDLDVTVIMAGDNQMDSSHLPLLLGPIISGEADYAKGNRLYSKASRRGMSSWRYFGNVILSLITKVCSGYWHITDSQNGYTAISRKALKSIDLSEIYTYYGYCNDLLIRLNASGQRVVDVEIPARYGQERSKIKYSCYIARVSLMMFRGFMWRMNKKMFPPKWPQLSEMESD